MKRARRIFLLCAAATLGFVHARAKDDVRGATTADSAGSPESTSSLSVAPPRVAALVDSGCRRCRRSP